MATQYIMALEGTEKRARTVQRKFFRNRPLGKIEREYHYTPPQPVLSCRTVNIDVTGTRTYRARSTDDIITEQHQLIHNVYLKARNKSAPAQKRPFTTKEHRNSGPLKSLSIEGSYRQAVVSPSSRSEGPRTPRSLEFGLRKKARTKSARLAAKPWTDTFLKINPDQEYVRTSQAFKEVNRQVREQWEDQNHALDEGKFVRGKKQEGGASLDPKTGNQWLTFGGGVQEKEEGVIDAFTGMADESKYYSIDGLSGTAVAKQLRKGQRILIGRNGQAVPGSARMHAWGTDSDLDGLVDNFRSENQPPERVSLFWGDEVTRPEFKVISPRGAAQVKPSPNLCETHPVVFQKLLTDDKEAMRRKLIKKAEGKRVITYSKPRSGVDGRVSSNSKITSISISTGQDEDGPEEASQKLTYEDIISLRTSQHTVSLPQAPEHPRQSPRAAQQGTAAVTSLPGRQGQHTQVSDGTNGAGRGSSHKSRGQSGRQQAASPTSVSSQELDSLVIRSAVAEKQAARMNIPRQGSAKGGKIVSSKPVSASGSTGASISAHGPRGETTYISFTSQLPLSKEPQGPLSQGVASAPLPSNEAIDSVKDYNEVNGEKPGQTMPSGIVVLGSKPSTPTMEPRKEGETSRSQGSSPRAVTPVSSPVDPEIQYAFNIPTADKDESEVNSFYDPSDFDSKGSPEMHRQSTTMSRMSKSRTINEEE